jgi:two-component system response regulator AtoC
VGCIRRGAFDYLEKPFDDPHRIQTTVRKAIDRRSLVRRNHQLEDELRARSSIPEFVGKSPGMLALASKIHSLRHNESHVLIQGESGTGKELVAYAVHSSSPRASGDFVPVDCGALPETIIESELFGHEKGAFTGAIGASGLFRIANRGTLFLDEIGEIPPHVQAKLLRALQHKEVRPVGASSSVPIDIRVISATHRDLATMVDEGDFRTDLFYRLNVVRIVIPPLRERREDIPLLVHHFLRKHADENSRVEGIDERALELLMASDWPGNVRELENTIESAMALRAGVVGMRGRCHRCCKNSWDWPQYPLSETRTSRHCRERPFSAGSIAGRVYVGSIRHQPGWLIALESPDGNALESPTRVPTGARRRAFRPRRSSRLLERDPIR